MNTLAIYARRSLAACALSVASVACTHLSVDDCGDAFAHDVTRIRSSHVRMRINDTAAAAARFAPYALMSAISYFDGPDCGFDAQAAPLVPAKAREREALSVELARAGEGSAPWEINDRLGSKGICEDDQGLLLQVWQQTLPDRTNVVVAFRGTSGANDWLYGNAWWFTRFVLTDNQYTRSRAHVARIIEHYAAQNKTTVLPRRIDFTTTGHSLGGGLAQHALYAFPDKIRQAITFDPTPVTAFADVEPLVRARGCECLDELGAEARIYRVYESYEILSDFRIFHKTFFPPHRHIHEVRFAFQHSANPVAQHSMAKLASRLAGEAAAKSRAADGVPWFASEVASCTAAFVDKQAVSCRVKAGSSLLAACPQ